MATEIFGIKTVLEQPKARIELLICGNIPIKEFTADEIIEMLVDYKVRLKELNSSRMKEIIERHASEIIKNSLK